MKRILLVGDHPSGFTGNGHMMSAIIKNMTQEAEVHVFAVSKAPKVFDPSLYPYIIEGGLNPCDLLGAQQLINRLQTEQYDIVLFVGLDIWVYGEAIPFIRKLRDQKKFVWAAIFPYDMHEIRADYVEIINWVDFPCVYSQYGFDKLKPVVPALRYFRPPLYDSDKFVQYDNEQRAEARSKMFRSVSDETFIFGFFGNNQFRKDPQRIIKAFFLLKKKHPNISLYLHTELGGGVFNLRQYIEDCGGEIGDIQIKKQDMNYSSEQMVAAYNTCDAYVSASLQEGLNWTILEAMLCGLPVIASYNTAHMELIQIAGHCVPCTSLAFVPVLTKNGPSYVESWACGLDDLVFGMEQVLTDPEYRERMIHRGKSIAKDWLKEVSSIDELLSEMISYQERVTTAKVKRNAVLFVQHSSAGDVLMTTQCFKGIKERHPDIPFVYMTQPQYQDIIRGNPYVDEIIDFDPETVLGYSIVYNPHGDRILPGGFNSLDVTLYSMYPYFCKVEAGDMYIEEVDPKLDLPEKYIVVHTTGGDTAYRTYNHMDFVSKYFDSIGIKSVQVGSKLDKVVKGAIDMRGLLSWRETAWVMKRAAGAVVIDSFPAHLAGALGTPVVVLFGPAPARVTKPRTKSGLYKIVCLEPNKLDVCKTLTNCWGRDRSCQSPCINTINPMKVIEAMKTLLEKRS